MVKQQNNLIPSTEPIKSRLHRQINKLLDEHLQLGGSPRELGARQSLDRNPDLGRAEAGHGVSHVGDDASASDILGSA